MIEIHQQGRLFKKGASGVIPGIAEKVGFCERMYICLLTIGNIKKNSGNDNLNAFTG